MKDPANPVCRTISALLQRIGDKWSLLVVQTLGDGSRRFNQLRREIPSISQRMLTLTLRNLERDGLVTWAMDHSDAIHAAQASYDAELDRREAA
jgi:DNA-binding HxlR family transcriptional regulator